MGLKNYFDFAENDYQYFQASCEAGIVANMMGAMAQGICEKYMKYLIDQYDLPDDALSAGEHEAILRTHNLKRLMKYLEIHLDMAFSSETKSKMKVINGFYFSTRYPGEDSVELDEEDIEDCAAAVLSCREEVLRFIKAQG